MEIQQCPILFKQAPLNRWFHCFKIQKRCADMLISLSLLHYNWPLKPGTKLFHVIIILNTILNVKQKRLAWQRNVIFYDIAKKNSIH